MGKHSPENSSLLTTVIIADSVHLVQSIVDILTIEGVTLAAIEVNINEAPLIHNKYAFYQILLAEEKTQLANLTGFLSISINSHLLETRIYAPVALESLIKLLSIVEISFNAQYHK